MKGAQLKQYQYKCEGTPKYAKFQVRVEDEILDQIRQIPNWQDKFREMLPEIIERLKEVSLTPH